MDDSKPTYEELKKMLAEAEALIASLRRVATKAAGTERDIAEDERDIAEDERDIAEDERDIAEDKRDIPVDRLDNIAEDKRDAAEDKRDAAENKRDAAEGQRDLSESELDFTKGGRGSAQLNISEFEEAYIKSEENFRNSMDACPLGIRVITADGDCFYANRAILDICGYSSIEQLEAAPKEQLYTLESYTAHLERKEKRQRGEYVPPEYEISIRRPDGAVRILRVFRKEITWGGAQRFMAMYEDITDRVRAEKSLMESRELFTQAFYYSPVLMLITSQKEGRIFEVNEFFCKATGYSREELLGRTTTELKLWHNREQRKVILDSLKEKGIASGIEVELRVKSGEIRIIDMSLAKVTLKNEPCLIAIAEDITDRKKAQEELIIQRDFNQSMFRTAQMIMLVLNPDGSILTFNPYMEEISGYTLDEVRDKSWFEIFIPERDRARTKDYFLKTIENVDTKGNINAILTKDGREHEIEWRSKTLNGPDGSIVGVLAVGQDVTERRKLEASIRYHASLVQNVSDAIISSDVNYRLLSWNKAAEEMYGWREEEVIGKTVMEITNPVFLNTTHQEILSSLRKNGYWKGEAVHHRKDGKKINVLMSISLIRDENGNETGAATVFKDITERIKAEAALLASEERYRSSLDNMMEGCQIIDRDWRYIYVNDAAAQQGRQTKEQLLGRTMMEVYPGIEKTEGFSYLKKCMEKRLPHRMANEFTFTDGSSGWFELSIQPVPEGIFILSLDITESRRADISIHENEERLRRIFQASPMGIVLYDLNYKFTMMNARFCELYGYTEEELKKLDFKDIAFEEDLRKNYPNLQKLVNGELQYYDTEIRNKKKNGDIFWGDVTVTLLRDSAGKPQGFLTLVQDITRRKEDKERINHLNLTLRSIRNVSQLITREKDRDRLIQGICDNLVVSRSFRSAWIVLLDDSRQPVTWAETNAGDGFPALIESFKQGQIPRCVQKALTQKRVVVTNDPYEQCTGCPILGEVHGIGSMTIKVELDGNIYGVLCSSLPQNLLSDDDEKSLFDEIATDIAFALRDIELEATNEQLKQERLRAAKLESIGTLAGGIAHDFNNLLTGIMGNIGLAKSYLPASGKVFEMLDEAERAAARSRDLTQQLLTFARGGKPIKKPISINGLIKEAATFGLRGSKVRLELSLPEDLWHIEADEGQISQVIHNLVINADDAMPHGGYLKITAKNIIVKRGGALPLSGGNYIQIDICDTGMGISPEQLQRIFEPYFTTKHRGSGLGLTTAYSIIKNHGGSLFAESTLNQGSVFHIYLPASRKTRKGEKQVAATKSTQAGGKVLIMDDDATIRKMLTNMLNLAGYEVEATADGAEALEKYKQAMEARNPFTTVIMDLTIPGGMGGKEAIKELLEIDPAASVIVSSGYATDAIMSEYKKYGFSAVIAKPYSIRQLQETITGLSPKKK